MSRRLRFPCTNSRRVRMTATCGRRDTGLTAIMVITGAGDLGPTARAWNAMDSQLLGMERKSIWLLPGILGHPGWILWRRQLWLWLRRDGYQGGRWQGNNFYYNSSVNNIRAANRYRYADATAARQAGNVSYNGGDGGVQAQPSEQQRQFASARHMQPTSVQAAHVRAASTDRDQLASVNGGRPVTPAVATAKSYKRVAQQHATAQPLTKRDSVKGQQASAAKNNPAASPSPQINAEKLNPPADQSPETGERHNVVAQPDDKPLIKPQSPVYNTQPRPEAEAQPQSRPKAVVPAQHHPEAEESQTHSQAVAPAQHHPEAEKSQPRPQAAALAQHHPEAAKSQPRPEAGAKPQGQAEKPQAH